MSDDILNELQASKNRQSSLRAKLQQRKREREGLAAELKSNLSNTNLGPSSVASSIIGETVASNGSRPSSRGTSPAPVSSVSLSTISQKSSSSATALSSLVEVDVETERKLLLVLCDISLDLPSNSSVLAQQTSTMLGREVVVPGINALLEKFAQQELICISKGSGNQIIVNSIDLTKLSETEKTVQKSSKRMRENDEDTTDPPSKIQKLNQKLNQKLGQKEPDNSIESLLSMESAKEKENKKLNEEILSLLSAPTAKEQYLVEKFKTRGGPQLQEFCQYGTKEECQKVNQVPEACKKLHFRKIIRKHTDESLGDCSFLNTCFHMDLCKYVHYEIDYPDKKEDAHALVRKDASQIANNPDIAMFPPQYIQCDLRTFDMSVLGKCAVVMADPPWDIHMELPYGTMSDDEMRRLPVPVLQEDGFIFLWVTGRAMELGRECLALWGYHIVDELIWVKTNQLQRIIRTGRTGHWINHGKEHCLVGIKGNPKGVNKGLDCDVIVAEVRATSHKPDEIYGIIERLSPGTRKVELFGRPHNVQPNWITLGNQVEGVCLKDPDIVARFREVYPDGNCMVPPQPR